MPPTQLSDKRKAAAPRAPRGAPAGPGAFGAAEGGTGAFAEADAAPSGRAAGADAGVLRGRCSLFGARLARALDALLAMQRADFAQIARGPRGAMAAIFTTLTPTGPSLLEADSLTLHYLCGGVSLAALVAHHHGALPHVAAALDGLEIADVRMLLWERAALALGSQGDGAPAPP